VQQYVSGASARRRRFAVTVDGVRHEVIVEELDASPGEGAAAGGASPAGASTAGAAAPSRETSPPPPAADAGANGVSADGWVAAPMPGTVTEVEVEVGDQVEAGDVLVILTAMKLENEINAPVAGKVKAVAVAEGDTVNIGDRLVQLDAGGAGR